MNTATRNKRDELNKLFQDFDGDLKPDFIEQFPEIWDDCYDIMEDSRYHRLMLKCLNAGFDAAYVIARKEVEVLVGGFIDKIKILKEALKAYD